MKNTLIFLQIFIISLAFISCSENEDLENHGTVALFLIEEFEKSNQMFQIDENSVITESSPLLNYEDFLSYEPSTFTYEISNHGQTKIKNLNHSVHGIAFAMKANDELIFTGYFWPAYSSMSCDWLTVDPLAIEYRGKGAVSLGYPGPHPGFTIPDKRNDPRILEIFRRDHKLVE